eukprot:3799884-Prymnesium_polylepis.1
MAAVRTLATAPFATAAPPPLPTCGGAARSITRSTDSSSPSPPRERCTRGRVRPPGCGEPHHSATSLSRCLAVSPAQTAGHSPLPPLTVSLSKPYRRPLA